MSASELDQHQCDGISAGFVTLASAIVVLFCAGTGYHFRLGPWKKKEPVRTGQIQEV